MYTAEEADFMNQLLGNCSVPQHLHGDFKLGTPSASWPGYELMTIVSVKGNNNSTYFPADAPNINSACSLAPVQMVVN